MLKGGVDLNIFEHGETDLLLEQSERLIVAVYE